MFRSIFSKGRAAATLDAIGRSLAIVEFEPNGTILAANTSFCRMMGYDPSEIIGCHHRIFVERADPHNLDDPRVWQRVGAGGMEPQHARRLAKGGREVWVRASYAPVTDARGTVVRVVETSVDVTAEALRKAELEGMRAALSDVQAVAEFTLDGEIITANDRFLGLLGYRLDEIQGRHHRMLLDPVEALSNAYDAFWDSLRCGVPVSASVQRRGKAGKAVWIQASYIPIRDLNEKVTKIVAFANDLSELAEIGDGLARLSDTDFRTSIARPFSSTFEKLRLDFNGAHDSLKTALSQIATSSTGIDSRAFQIAIAKDGLSRRTELQAAAIKKTAAAFKTVTAASRESATDASHAHAVVCAADVDARTSAVVVQQAVEAMGAIAQSAQQITDIAGVIDEIAFQTNLLALNAGVEAARAGQAGRGFAVVASQVRALAQRSAQAAKEIKALLAVSAIQVDRGVRMVAETGTVLDRIALQVARLNGILLDIATDAQEQSSRLDQMNTAVIAIDHAAQRDAATVEETTAASHALSGDAAWLAALVGKFDLAPGDAEREARRSRATPTSRMRQAAKPTVPARGTAPRLVSVNTGAVIRHAVDSSARQMPAGRIVSLRSVGSEGDQWDEI